MFYKSGSELFVPDGTKPEAALKRCDHIAVSAHQDDIEIMAVHGVLQCFGRNDHWFCGCVVTDGAGSPRDDLYANTTDDQMKAIRKQEQRKAAYVGEYGALALLNYSSSETKHSGDTPVVDDLEKLFRACQAETIYLHNLADKHPTHVATALRCIYALRRLPADLRPKRLLGCEVWRDLDWLVDDQKVGLDVSGHENVQNALLGVFDSQICGGKRYDLSAMGRRRAHATYFASHGVDSSELLCFAMDLTPLMEDDTLSPLALVEQYMKAFEADVRDRLRAMG